MKKIVIATNNEHKLKEFKEILIDYEILSLRDIKFDNEIEETGETFKENALIKAKTISEYLKENNLNYDVLAEDSGLCVDSLDGAPGVYSARYSGDHGNSLENRKKLINNLQGKERDAFFISVLVLYHSDDTYEIYEGRTYGNIIDTELGDTSFGYDCIFFSKDLNKTFGEATAEEKNSVSHRSRAIKNMINEVRFEE